VVALSLVERIVEWIEPAFLVAGYFIILGGVLLERSIFIGLIIPGDFILALGVINAARGDMTHFWVIVIGKLAAIAG
jgi:membrane protein DedA with SNARE-associated domain